MFIPSAYAQAAGAGASASTMGSFLSIAPLVLIFVLFYFLMIRPQQRRMKEHQAAVGGIKKGDQIVTAGGLLGKVVRVEDDVVEIELGPNVKVRAVKSTIAEVKPAGGAKPAND